MKNNDKFNRKILSIPAMIYRANSIDVTKITLMDIEGYHAWGSSFNNPLIFEAKECTFKKVGFFKMHWASLFESCIFTDCEFDRKEKPNTSVFINCIFIKSKPMDHICNKDGWKCGLNNHFKGNVVIDNSRFNNIFIKENTYEPKPVQDIK